MDDQPSIDMEAASQQQRKQFLHNKPYVRSAVLLTDAGLTAVMLRSLTETTVARQQLIHHHCLGGLCTNASARRVVLEDVY